MDFIKSDLVKSIVLLPLLDYVYLNAISSKFNQQILEVQKSPMTFRLIPAIICYVALIFVLNYFILNSDINREQKVLNAFLLGLSIYAVYETTNYALLENWKLDVVIIDTVWGGILFALATYLITL